MSTSLSFKAEQGLGVSWHSTDVLLSALVMVLTLCGLACAVEGWRRWFHNRRITKHFQQYETARTGWLTH